MFRVSVRELERGHLGNKDRCEEVERGACFHLNS